MYEKIALDYVKKLEKLLAGKKFNFDVSPGHIPKKKPGVYVIFNKNAEIIYVGRTKDLNRRILRDHKLYGSQFRTALMREYKLVSKEEVSKYITDNCSFLFKQIEDTEDRIRLEHFAVAVLGPILNVKLKNA